MIKKYEMFEDPEEVTVSARDLHDGLVQLMVAAMMHLDCALGESDEAAKMVSIGRAGLVLDDAIAEARRLIAGQPPVGLEDGLQRAVHRLLDDCVARDELRIQRFIDAEPDMSPDVRVGIYRICQEALSNIRRHSHARQVSVVLLTVGEVVHLRVQDDGLGFEQPDRCVEQHGLRSIQHRVGLLGGCASVTSRESTGTEIVIEVPLYGKA